MGSFDKSIDSAMEKFKYRDLKGNGLKIDFGDAPQPNFDFPTSNNVSNISKPLSISPELLRIIGIILIVVLITVAVLLILKIVFKIDFKKKKVENDIVEEIIGNDYTPNELESIINKYEIKDDYKNSIRYLFIYLLIYLKQKEIIKIHSTKTNSQIAEDVENNYSTIYIIFLGIINTFNRTWYGNKYISKDDYFSTKNIIKQIMGEF